MWKVQKGKTEILYWKWAVSQKKGHSGNGRGKKRGEKNGEEYGTYEKKS